MKPTGIRNRREPIPAMLYQPAEGQTCIRTPENRIRKDIERDLARKAGRPLTKRERKEAKKLAAGVLAELRRRQEEAKRAVQPPKPAESLIARPGPLLVDPRGRAIA